MAKVALWQQSAGEKMDDAGRECDAFICQSSNSGAADVKVCRLYDLDNGGLLGKPCCHGSWQKLLKK